MKFGKVENPDIVDFTLPQDASDTQRVLQSAAKESSKLEVSVGCAKWNKTDLKGFYPRGTKDELSYYSIQFNSIELNATFYKMPDVQQVITWKEKTPEGFKFFPKLTDLITHYRRLINVQELIENFCQAISLFEEKLGMAFMQLHENFAPKDYERLSKVLQQFPPGIPLAVEVRNEKWFTDTGIRDTFFQQLEELGITNIIVDTAGRRDMLHMRLTTPVAFIRFVGANLATDKERLDDWVQRIKIWHSEGLQQLYFFVHQNVEVESPFLAGYFIERLNSELGLQLPIPQKLHTPPPTLFD